MHILFPSLSLVFQIISYKRFPSLFYSGTAADVIPNLKRDFGVAIVDLMFLDHSASSYVSDVAVASAQNFLAAGDRQFLFVIRLSFRSNVVQDPVLLQTMFYSLAFLVTPTQ